MEPSIPSGNAIDSSFTVEWTAELGTHEIRLELDPYDNITQSRTDNDNYSKQLIVFVSKPELNFELTYNKVEPRETDKVSFKIPERYDEVK